jgi:hypothetical protein
LAEIRGRSRGLFPPHEVTVLLAVDGRSHRQAESIPFAPRKEAGADHAPSQVGSELVHSAVGQTGPKEDRDAPILAPGLPVQASFGEEIATLATGTGLRLL